MVGRNQVGIELTAKDLASREISRVGGSLETLGEDAESTGHHFGVLGSIARGLFQGTMIGAGMFAFNQIRNGFGFVKSSAIDFNNQLQQATIGFTTMLGSGQKAKAFLDQLQGFAQTTPFEFSGLISSTQRLLAMGFSAKSVLPTLTAIGDAMSGLGVGSEGIDRATLALGQLHAHGTVDAQDMLQLTELGVPAWDMLAKGIGKTTAETMKLAERGLIPADKAIGIITKGMEERFGGLMSKNSKTFSGAMSNVHDVLQNVMATAFRPFFDSLASGANSMANFLSQPGVMQFAQNFANGLAAAMHFFGSITAGISGFISLMERARDPVAMFGHIIDIVTTAVEHGINGWIIRFNMFINHIGPMVPKIVSALFALSNVVHDKIVQVLAQLLPALTGFINQIAANLPGLLNKVVPVILAWVKQAAESWMKFIGQAVDVLAANAPQLIDALSNLLQTAFDWLINTGVPMAANAIGPLSLEFIDWVFKVLPKLLDVLDDLVNAVIAFIIKNGPVLAGKLIEWAEAFVGWVVTNVVPRLVANLPTILRVLLLFVGGAALKLVGKFGELGAGLVGKIVEFLSQLPGKFGEWLANVLPKVVAWAAKLVPEGAKAGADFAGKLVGFVATLPSRIGGLLVDVLKRVVGFAGDLVGKGVSLAANFVSKIVSHINDLPGDFGRFLSQVIGNVGSFASHLVADGAEAASRFIGRVGDFIGKLPGQIGKWLGDIVQRIRNWGSDLLTGAIKAAGDFVRGFINGLGSLPGKVAGAIASAFSSIHIDIGPFHISASGVSIDLPHISLPGFASGAWKLPADMVARVHKGEMIIPADIAARLRGEVGAPSPESPTVNIATAAAAGPAINVAINNYYGPSSVRSTRDIEEISRGQAERARLLGVSLTSRTVGSLGF